MFPFGRGVRLRSHRGLAESIWCGTLAAAAIATVAVGTSGPENASGFSTPSGTSDTHMVSDRLPWTDANCGSCHEADRQLMHPTGLSPSMRVPAELPLEGGQMTCVTCHQAADPEQHASARSTHSDLLRMPAQQLCAQCHTPSAGGRSDAHAKLVTKAHPNSNESQSQSLLGIDKESLACMSCHDGSLDMGSSRSFASAGGSLMGAFHAASQSGETHPIGTEYPAHARRGAKSMVPRSRLDGRIRLFDNMVGCGSCHSPYSQEKKLLVIDNRGSQLCLSCHDL